MAVVGLGSNDAICAMGHRNGMRAHLGYRPAALERCRSAPVVVGMGVRSVRTEITEQNCGKHLHRL